MRHELSRLCYLASRFVAFDSTKLQGGQEKEYCMSTGVLFYEQSSCQGIKVCTYCRKESMRLSPA